MPSIGAVRYASFVQEFNALQMNIAILASGEGTTLQAVLDACAGGRLAARVAVVISNNPSAGALRRARSAGVPARHLSAVTAGGRIINTHPALLPEFGGEGMFGSHVHRAVLAAGRRISGATVHWVDENYDT